ncbi:MAG: hypothetical protein JRJ59_11600 [Deltaproteobacteria bacterium]|nr:hypothetical protein [Deltaproteobacteria bacterium]
MPSGLIDKHDDEELLEFFRDVFEKDIHHLSVGTGQYQGGQLSTIWADSGKVYCDGNSLAPYRNDILTLALTQFEHDDAHRPAGDQGDDYGPADPVGDLSLQGADGFVALFSDPNFKCKIKADAHRHPAQKGYRRTPHDHLQDLSSLVG